VQLFRGSHLPLAPADVSSFVGSARSKRLSTEAGGVPAHVYHVEFDQGARTNWHTHSGPQWLIVIDGRVRVQTWQDAPQDVIAGDVVVVSPGEKHWHGAAPGSRGAHIAVNLNAVTTWLEPVSDDEYRQPPQDQPTVTRAT
jgi:4-carboxymuconolactone decarboxylase